MAVISIESKEPIPNCGNCDRELAPTTILQVFIYNSQNEIPTEIKSGEINLSVCPYCEYNGSIYYGLLTIDRDRKRAVFCLNDESVEAEKGLSKCWDEAGQYLSNKEIEEISRRTVDVYEYRHIYELLCADERIFSIEVISGEKYKKRQKIEDVRKRAEQFWTDVKEAGNLILTSRESSYEFLTALRDILTEDLDTEKNEQNLENIRQFLSAIEVQLQNSVPSPKKIKVPIDPVLNIEDFPPDSVVRTISSAVNPIVTSALNELIDDSPGYVELEKLEGNQEYLTDYNEAYRYLLGNPDNFPEDFLEKLLSKVINQAPDITVTDFDGESSPLSHFLAKFDSSNNSYIEMLGDTAFHYLEEKPLFGAALARYFAGLRIINGARYAGFEASLLCIEFFAGYGLAGHYASTLAFACQSYASEGVQLKMAYIPKRTYRKYAICWERIAEYFQTKNEYTLASLCSGISTKYFKFDGDLNGEIRSRLDSIKSTIYSPGYVKSEVIEQLLADILRFKEMPENAHLRKNIQVQEIECLQLFAIAQIIEWGGNPEVIGLELSLGFVDKDGTKSPTNFPSDLEFPLDRFKSIDQTLSENKKHPFAKELKLAKDSRISTNTEPELCSDGYVLLSELRFDDKPDSYTIGVQTSSIEWLSTLRYVLKLAEKYEESSSWFVTYELLIKSSLNIHPKVSIYFYRLMMIEKEEAGFSEIPSLLFTSIQIDLAEAYTRLSLSGNSSYLQDAVFLNLLDLIDSGSIDDAILKKEFNLPSFIKVKNTGPKTKFLFDAFMTMAEILEAGGKYTSAIKRYRNFIDFYEEKIRSAESLSNMRIYKNKRVTGLYRLARANLKHYRETEDYGSLIAAMNAIESYKSRSILSDSYSVDNTNSGDEHSGDEQKTTSFRALRINDLGSYFPEDSYIMIFALLQKTDINTGFWFSALVRVADQQVLFPRFIEFNDIYEPAFAVKDAFQNAQSHLVNKLPSEIPEVAHLFDPQIKESLEELGSALFPADVVEFLETEQAERLIIVPESYLFDVPFPALKIRGKNRLRYLFELNEDKGTAVSVAPNLTHFQNYKPKSPLYVADKDPDFYIAGKKSESPLTIILSTSPGWRKNFVPIYGIGTRIRKALKTEMENYDREAEQSTHKNTIEDFLKSLVKSRTVLFFGHGEIAPAEGSVLILDDGIISKYEIDVFSGKSRFKAETLILCACSGINANVEAQEVKKDISGVHVSLLKGGVRCIIGSLIPVFPISALALLEQYLKKSSEDYSCDKKLTGVYRYFISHPEMSSPLFWGHLIGFGDALFKSKK